MAVTSEGLRVRGLHIAAGDRVLVEDLSLTLAPGATLGLSGPSGVGKTTFARAVAGLTDTAGAVRCRGQILVGGGDVVNDRDHAEDVRGRDVVLIPQNALTSLPPLLAVGDLAAALAGSGRRATAARLVESLAGLGVADPERAIRARPAGLSGGERQRVLLAIALLKRPKLLIADEPTANLDEDSGALVERALRTAHRLAGFALIVISHDQGLLERLCARRVRLGSDPRHARRPGRQRPVGAAATKQREPETMGCFPQRHTIPFPSASPRTAGGAAAGAVLAAENLTIRRNGRILIDNVCLSLARGSRLAVVGRSGAGKTTLARALAGLARPSNGAVRERLRGGDSWRSLRRPNRGVQLMFQDPAASFDPRLTVFHSLVLAAGRSLRGASERRSTLAALAERVRLDPAVLDRGPRRISGGECQRAALLRALLCEPQILIADEPASSLDPESARAVQEILEELVRERRLGLVLVSHDLAFVRAICSHALILERGRVAWTGRIADLSGKRGGV